METYSEIEKRIRERYGYSTPVEQARDFSAEQRAKLAKSGAAMSDGSFPIVTKADLRNAIAAYGRAGNKAAAKRHIIKRAKALGATDLLPDDWKRESAEWSFDPDDVTRAFLVEADGKTILTAPAALGTEQAAAAHPFMWLTGAFVGAEQANRNGAFWTTGDLEFGEPSVKHGPLNWLHKGRHIIGAIAEAAMERPEDRPPYIAAKSAVWRWLWPDEARVIEQASESRQLWYSMECISREVSCRDHGCGAYPYMDAQRGLPNVCEHVREKSGTRHFVDPLFLGGAVIVPPVRPGWAEATVDLMREAASFAEVTYKAAGEPDYSATEWEGLLAQVLGYAHSA